MSWQSSRRHAAIGRWSTALASVVLSFLVCSLAACGGGSTAAHHAKPTPVPTSAPAPKGWSTVASPGVGQEGDLRAVTSISATEGWAVGQYEGLDSLQHTLTERWNGTDWTFQPSPNPSQEGNMLQAVSGSSASDVWAVGYQIVTGGTDLPLIEHWNGTAWSVVASPVQKNSAATLSGVAAVSPTDAWAVGTIDIAPNGNTPPGQTPLIEHWNGSAWSIVNGAAIPLPSGSSVPQNSLAAVTALSANDVWAVGADYTDTSKPMEALIEHWNGQHWTLVHGANPNAAGNGLSGIAAVSPNDIWAVGSGAPSVVFSCGYVSSVLIEHWNGSAWSSVPVALPASSQGAVSLASIAATSANDVWAVGGQNVYSASAGSYIAPVAEHWNGTAWSLASNPNVNTSHGLAGVAAGHGGAMLTVGQYEAVNGPSATLAEQANGTTLSLVESASPGTLYNSLQAVTSISANDAWAVGSSAGGNLAEHWDGNAWTVSTVPNPSQAGDSLGGVSGASTNDVWAVGSANNSAAIAHWNGSQWGPVSAPVLQDSSLSGVVALSASNAWAVGGANGPLVERWNDTKWSAVATPTSSQGTDLTSDSLLAVAAVSPSDIWAVGGTPPHNCGGQTPALIEHWNGSAWSVIPNLPQGLLYGVTAVSANDVWAVGSGGNGGNGAFILHWDGKQWSTVTAPPPPPRSCEWLQSVAAHNANDVWAVGVKCGTNAGSQVAVLHWDGHVWSDVQVSAPGIMDNALYGITAVSDGELWAVGQYDDDNSGPFTAHQALIEHFQP